MLKLNFYVAWGLVTLSGCLWFLAVTPFDLSALAWIAAVPLLFAVDRAATVKQALFLGSWAGFVETAGGFYWLVGVTQRFAGFPWWAAVLVLLLFCATRAIIFLLFTGVICGIRNRRRVPMTLLAPITMVSCEFLVPQLFPCGQWISQAWHPMVIQIAELTGPLGVTALLMLVNGALYDLCVDGRAARYPALVATGVVAATFIFASVRMQQVDDLIAHAPRLKVGLVQPNFAYTTDGNFSREETLRQLTALQAQSHRLQQAGAQLLVWSEGSYPIALPRDFKEDFAPESLAMIRRGFDVPTIIGAEMYDATHDQAFNSAILLDGNGRMAGRYDKVQLLAFGEYIPGVDFFPWIRKLLPAGAGQFTAGQGAGVVTLADVGGQSWALGPVICYEDILPGFLQDVGRLRPNLLVNLTSDSWFGADTEPWEHLALAVFASVELRVSMVRAVNSGVSSLIDPNGRLLNKTYADDPYRNPHTADGIVVTAPRMQGEPTLYVTVGNLFAYLCMAVTAIFIATSVYKR